ncbi:hypothetical protein [Verminephrobacter eiseniae]|uniref:hypothetical protein n=1 Tax=Verminephrobacter eiseniae TaxID=364317 RepID=UPI00223838D9|nr:hypothetical protein [Verminephrobacter eiseniae]MCW5236163.1 hypothetical protein [Verminephrobacter eiseniae]
MRHSTGTVGVIIDLQCPASLHAVSPEDAGSYEDEYGVRRVTDQEISQADLVRSLTERGSRYNEWVVRNYVVRGIFVAEPLEVWRSAQLAIPLDASHLFASNSTDMPQSIDVAEVLDAFPNVRVLTFDGKTLVDVRTKEPISHANLYLSSIVE